MTGQPGRSGGARPGSGRKRKPAIVAVVGAPRPAVIETPLEYALRVMNDRQAKPARRDWAAIVAAPYVHARCAPGGSPTQSQTKGTMTTKPRFLPTSNPEALSARRNGMLRAARELLDVLEDIEGFAAEPIALAPGDRLGAEVLVGPLEAPAVVITRVDAAGGRKVLFVVRVPDPAAH